MATIQSMDGSTTLAKTALIAGEALLPGASNLVAGNIGVGVGHLIGTGLAVAVLAPSMPVLAGLAAIGLRVNSYKLATTGTSLLDSAAAALNGAREHGQTAAPASARTTKAAP
jgi:hypothetical protein